MGGTQWKRWEAGRGGELNKRLDQSGWQMTGENTQSHVMLAGENKQKVSKALDVFLSEERCQYP